MATLTAVNPRVVENALLPIVERKVLSGQTWKAGQWLFSDANGLLEACATDAATNNGGIKYVALTDQADPGNSTTVVAVGLIGPDTTFLIHELNGAVDTANEGGIYGIDVTGNVVTMDEAEVTAVAVQVIKLGSSISPVEYADVDVKGVCLVKVLPVMLNAPNA